MAYTRIADYGNLEEQSTAVQWIHTQWSIIYKISRFLKRNIPFSLLLVQSVMKNKICNKRNGSRWGPMLLHASIQWFHFSIDFSFDCPMKKVKKKRCVGVFQVKLDAKITFHFVCMVNQTGLWQNKLIDSIFCWFVVVVAVHFEKEN